MTRRTFGAAALVLGTLLPTPSLQAQCRGFRYMKGVNALARHDIAAEITDIQFESGDEPKFTVHFTVDAENLGPFKVAGKMGIAIENARIGPGRRANASKCFRFGPTRLKGPGPFKATFRLRGGDWNGVLPQANYKASIDVALHQQGRIFRDLNVSDNSSEMSKKYVTKLVAKRKKIDGDRQSEDLNYAVTVVNTGNRPTGPLRLKWWTRGHREWVDHDGIDGDSKELLAFDFERPDGQKRFGRKAKLVVRDALKMRRLRAVKRIPNPDGTVVIDPEPEPEPIPDGVDYAVQDVHASVLSLGDGNFILSSSVVNQGSDDATETTKVMWESLSVDGPYSFRPLTRSLPALKTDEAHEMLAVLDLSDTSEADLRGKNVKGTLRVSEAAGEIDGDNNVVDFDLGLCSPPVEEPTPPQIVESEIESEALDPEYAGWDGEVSVAVQLQNNGGDAESVSWTVEFPELDLDPDNGGKFILENVGAGDTLEKEWISFVLPEDKYTQPGEDAKVYRGTISGTTRYRNGNDELVDGEAFQFPIEIEVGEYPRPDLDLSVYVTANGNTYVPRTQILDEVPADLEFNVQVDNNGSIGIHEDDPVEVSWEIPGFADQQIFRVEGLALGESRGGDSVNLSVDCGYWSGNREDLRAVASEAPSEERLANNEYSMGIDFNGSHGCP